MKKFKWILIGITTAILMATLTLGLCIYVLNFVMTGVWVEVDNYSDQDYYCQVELINKQNSQPVHLLYIQPNKVIVRKTYGFDPHRWINTYYLWEPDFTKTVVKVNMWKIQEAHVKPAKSSKPDYTVSLYRPEFRIYMENTFGHITITNSTTTYAIGSHKGK